MKGEMFSQKTRLIIFGSLGRQISVHRVIFLLIRIVNLEEICFNICQKGFPNTGIKNVRVARLFPTIEESVMLHFPSGAEPEINQRLMEKFAALGVNAWLDRANNARSLIKGRNRQKSIGITAHKKYEIGALE